MTVELKPKRWRPVRPASELAAEAEIDPLPESGIGFSAAQPMNRSELLSNSAGLMTGVSMDAAGLATTGEAASRLAERQADLVLLHRFAHESDAGMRERLANWFGATRPRSMRRACESWAMVAGPKTLRRKHFSG